MNKVLSNYLELFDVSYHYKNKLENVKIFKNLNLKYNIKGKITQKNLFIESVL